jgi:hypothetical protein
MMRLILLILSRLGRSGLQWGLGSSREGASQVDCLEKRWPLGMHENGERQEIKRGADKEGGDAEQRKSGSRWN